MIKIKEVIIVEGKYDKIKLKSILDATIIETNGFRIFKDKEKIHLLKQLADKNGLLILTDSDSGGFLIRNYLKGIISSDKIKHAYIPSIIGKEKRKDSPSKEGILGVEGMTEAVLKETLEKSGVLYEKHQESKEKITKQHFYELGLTGKENSKLLRTKLLSHLNMPPYLTAKAMIEALNSYTTLTNLHEIMTKIK